MTREIDAGPASDIPPGCMRLVPEGRYGIGVYNVGGRFHALLNYCVHEGAPLCAGRITGTTDAPDGRHAIWVREGEILRCPWHGWEFDIATGAAVAIAGQRVRTYPVSVRDGRLRIELPARGGA